MKVLQTIGWILVSILAIDALGFIAWLLSGQYPADAYYIGTITAHTLELFIH